MYIYLKHNPVIPNSANSISVNRPSKTYQIVKKGGFINLGDFSEVRGKTYFHLHEFEFIKRKSPVLNYI